ncbi:MAG: protein kinase [Deltaproteobacteria bacterium]|nr:protein kinase [Deltaproteobacteria bacterium]
MLGAFEIERTLGHGGMGVVWRGRHEKYDLPVAIKVLPPELSQSQALLASFRRELQAVASLDHPGVVVVVAHGVVTKSAEDESSGALRAGSPYFAMELANGTLGDVVPRVDLDWPKVRRYLLLVLDALAHAHARGFVHRDLKPANVLRFGWFERPELKLTDFGIAHSLESGGDIAESQIIGTPAYMAPEQIRGDARLLGPWTDLYALGCIAHELVAGRVPYGGASPIDVAQKHITEPIPELIPRMAVPEGFDQWVARMMAKEPRQRFQRAADAAWSLSALDEAVVGSARAVPDQSIEELPTLSVLLDKSAVLDSTLRETFEAHQLHRAGGLREMPAGRYNVPLSIPSTWRTKPHKPRSNELVAASLSLFGLRQPPLFGRDAELDALWAELVRVDKEDRPRAMILEGPAGIGKSRLARNFGERAEELGAANVFYAAAGRQSSSGDAIVATISRYFRISGLEPEHIRSRVGRALAHFDLPPDSPAHELAELIIRANLGDPLPLAEQAVVLSRFFEVVGRERPVVLICDDLQWDESALALTRHFLAAQQPMRVLVVHTLQEGEGSQGLVGKLADLAPTDDFRVIRMRPLSSSSHAALIDSMISLELSTRAKVVERTEGNPLLALQLIDAWVSEDALVLGKHGFSLRGGQLPPVRGAATDVVARLFGNLDERDQRAVEIAAMMGSSVAKAEWLAVCAHSDATPSDDLVNRLVASRLAAWTDAGWRFSHFLVRDSIEAMTASSGRRVEHHKSCAAVLARLGPGLDARVGRHLYHARDYQPAIDFLTRGARAALESESLVAAEELLVQRERSLRQLGVSANDRRVVEGWLLRTQLHSGLGRLDKAAMLAARTVAKVEVLGHHDLAAQAFLALATSQVSTGRLRDAADSYRQALTQAEMLDDQDSMARASLGLATVDLRRGKADLAEPKIAQAMRWAQTDEVRAEATAGLGDLALLRGERGLASGRFMEALALSRAADLPQTEFRCLSRLGDIYRERGHHERAEDYYRKCEEHYTAEGSPEGPVILLKRAYIELARGTWLEAENLASRAIRDFQRLGHRRLVTAAQLVLAAAAAGTDNWPELERALTASSLGAELGLDDLWVLQIIGERAQAAGKVKIAGKVLMAGRKLAVDLRRSDLVESIDALLLAPHAR